MASASLLIGIAAAPVAQAQFSTLYSFSGSDGANPQSVLIMDTSGNLYGTTTNGTTGVVYGTVFQLSSSGSLTTLNSFSTLNSGSGLSPYAGLVRDGSGNLYGTTAYGGAGFGTVFKIDGSGNFTTIYTFLGGPAGDGATPSSTLILDGSGNLYGTTANGGNTTAPGCNSFPAGCGTVFMLSPPPSSGPWTEQTLYTFLYTDGANPTGTLILDGSGNLYGTTQNGGTTVNKTAGAGTVFMLTKASSAPWQLTPLYTFSGGTDGANPYAGVIRDSSGNLYGTTVFGGSGYGTVFQLSPIQSTTPTAYNLTTLYPFTGLSDGANPYAGLAMGTSGTLYGAAEYGGTVVSTVTNCATGCGTIFELIPPSGIQTSYTFQVKYSFDNTDGANPYAGLLLDTNGNLYGTTLYGGAYANYPYGGTVFKITATTPKELIHALIGQVQGLVQSGALNSGEGTSLVAHLNSALRLLNMSNTTATISNLNGFIYEVQGLESGGQLDTTDAQNLIGLAQNIINLLSTT